MMTQTLPVVRLHAQLSGHGAAVYTLWPAAGGQFYSAGSDGLVALWQADTAESLGAVLRASAPVYALCDAPALGLLVAGQNDGGLHAVQTLPDGTRQLVRSVQVHRRPVFGLCVVPDQPWLLSAGGDGCLGIWQLPKIIDNQNINTDSAPLTCERLLPLSAANLRALAVSPDGRWLAVGASDGKIRLLSLDPAQMPQPPLLATWDAHRLSVFSLAFSADGQRLYSGGRDAQLCIWDVATCLQAVSPPEAAIRVAAHTFAVHHVALSPCGRYLATASMDKSIKLWSAESLRLLKVIDRRRLPAHASSVNRLCWLPAPDSAPQTYLLASCSDDSQVLVWHLDFAPLYS